MENSTGAAAEGNGLEVTSNSTERRVAVVGSGVSGLVAARTLALSGAKVVLYEKDSRIGGHSFTLQSDGVAIDLGFMVFNQVTYANMLQLFEEVGVEVEEADMSFGISLDNGKGCEWGSSGLAALFAQKRNMVNPQFLKMISELFKFEKDVVKYLEQVENGDSSVDANETLGEFLKSRNYSDSFRDCYLIPVCASIWSCSSETTLGFSAACILTFCRNHHLLQVFGRPQWLTVKGRSESYVNKVVEELKAAGSEIRTSNPVTHIRTLENGKVQVEAGEVVDYFDDCIVAAHAPDALEMRGEDATYDERCVLGAFQYVCCEAYVHRDPKFMAKNRAAWSAWNFLGNRKGRICVTYWLNIIQNLGDTGLPYLLTLNPPDTPEHVVKLWQTSHPVPSPAAVRASKMLDTVQGRHRIWYCGAYQGYGFHEDGVKSGLTVAKKLLSQKFEPLGLVKQMVPSWSEFGARIAMSSLLKKFVRTGHLNLVECGGTVLDFHGEEKGCNLSCFMRIMKPSFYWKIATRADLGIADAYIDGDFTFVDSKYGLLNLLQILIANRDLLRADVENVHGRGWWSPISLTSAVGTTLSYFRHTLRINSLTNSRRNISQHYDLSNDMFSLFLDETMTYSCAIFKDPSESLKDAQLRKLHLLIAKARIDSTHEVLEIGCGWGSMAMELVTKTGCRYTGITLSQEQLKFAEKRVKAAGLEDKISFVLCDYRTLPGHKKFHRIISCEMLEAVGHEYYKEFFRRCDYLLAKDGLLVVQTCSMPEERYEEYRRSSDFIKEYIFPGGCIPAFSTLTSAMTQGSSLCVEHMENIGPHYYTTLMCWRDNFLSKKSEIKTLGFGDKFIRMWEYYFIYCAAGYKTCTLGDLQMVFSRPGNSFTLSTPYINIVG